MPKRTWSQIWDGDLNIWINKSHLSLYLVIFNSIFFRYLDVQKNTYAQPNGFYPQDYLNSKCNTVFCHFVGPYCWHCSREKIAGREHSRAPSSQSSHLSNVNNWASKIPNKPCLHLNVNSPYSNAHLVDHKSSLWVIGGATASFFNDPERDQMFVGT